MTRDEEKTQAYKNVDKTLAKRYNFGRAAIYIIAAVQTVRSLLFMLGYPNFYTVFGFIFLTAISVLMLFSISAARYIMASCCFCLALFALYLSFSAYWNRYIAYMLMFGAATAFEAVSCGILFISEGISEYMYVKRNG